MIEWDRWYENPINGQPSKAITLIANLEPYMRKVGVRSVLDVGCGRGHLLEIFGKSGYVTTGTEIVESLLRNELVDRSVLPVDIATLIAEHKASEWDYVTFCDVLQYVPEDVAALALAWAMDAPHGFAVAMMSDVKGYANDSLDWIKAIERASLDHYEASDINIHIGALAWVIWTTR